MPQTNDAFALDAWLSEISADGSLSPEELKSLGTILGKDQVKSKLGDQFLMRRDYSRKTQEVADLRRQVDSDVQDILTERADLAKWKSGIDTQVKKVYGDLDAERSTVAQFKARMQTIAEQNGLDVNELTQGLSTARAATGAAVNEAANGNGNGSNGNQNFDASKYVPVEEFNRFARQGPLVQAELFDLANEHAELFGKPFKMTYTDQRGQEWSGAKALLMKTSEHNARNPNATKSLRDVWETDFQVKTKRDEQVRESIRNEERGKLDAEYKTRLSEQMINGGTPGRSQAPLDGRKSVLFDDKRDQRLPAEREQQASGGGDNGRNGEPPPSSAAQKEQRWQKAANGFLDRRANGVPLGQEAPAKTGL
jgi:hypothetical protein